MTANGGPPASAEEDAGGPDANGAEADGRSDPQVTGGPDQPQRQPANAGAILTPSEDARRQELSAAALAYAGRGMRVIPIRWMNPDGSCACHRGHDCVSKGKHPVHDDWPDVGSSDADVVGGWWRPEPTGVATEWYPMANIGVVTGRGSNVFVLDVDTYAEGAQTLGGYERRHGDLPLTRVHETGRGGQHFFFAHPGFDVRNSAKKVLGPGLDIKGERGFVVMPPSVSEYGPYDVSEAHDIDPAPAPEWLTRALSRHDQEQTGSIIAGEPPRGANGQIRAYAERAIESESLRMRTAPQGQRNDTLNQCAFSLGQLGGASILDEAQAFGALREAAMAAGLTEGEIRGTFLSGWRSGLKQPRNVQWGAMAANWPVRARNEFGLADRMMDHWGDQMRWCPELDTWLVYRNGVWVPATKREGQWAAQTMIRNLMNTEAGSYDDTREVGPDGEASSSLRDLFEEWVAKQENRKSVAAAAELAMGLPVMRMAQATFDGDPLKLNCRNGVVSLSSGELIPHDPEQRMTLQISASYDPEARAPRWEKFLEQVQPDPQMRDYLQRVAGYCATGLVSEQAAFLLHGTGANGKSVWIGVLSHILGTYAQTMPVETLMASSVDGRIPNDVARMAGKRMLQASETKAGKTLDEQRLKQLTGGDTVSARFMRGEWFDFRPVGKILLTTNHLPRMSDDSATWRRIHLITWDVVVPEEERDGYLQETLIREEAAGILAWIVRGALMWQENGLSAPQSVADAVREYQRDQDLVEQFIGDCLREVPEVSGHPAGSSNPEIYAMFKNWCSHQGHPPWTQHRLTSSLKKKGYKPRRSGGWSGFPGLSVKQFMPGAEAGIGGGDAG